MYSLTICFGPTGTTWAFMFKDKDRAYEFVATRSESPSLVIEDDFGQTAMIIKADIHGTVLEDLDVVEHAHIERQLANARMQFKAQERAKTDPIIRQAMGAQQRAPILQPMGNGRFGS